MSDLYLCRMPGGAHERYCPTCGCTDLRPADDLLAALQRAERVLGMMHHDGWKVGGDVLAELRAAIARATTPAAEDGRE